MGDDEAPSAAGDVDLPDDVVAIATGAAHTCALLADGTLTCWGSNARGQLGLSHTNAIGDTESPSGLGAVTLGAVAVGVAAGGDHTCALLEGGDVKCFGWGAFGQLGLGSTSNVGDNETPASVSTVDLGAHVATLALGARHSCALLVTARWICWGDGAFGKLGVGSQVSLGDDEVPADLLSMHRVAFLDHDGIRTARAGVGNGRGGGR